MNIVSQEKKESQCLRCSSWKISRNVFTSEDGWPREKEREEGSEKERERESYVDRISSIACVRLPCASRERVIKREN